MPGGMPSFDVRPFEKSSHWPNLARHSGTSQLDLLLGEDPTSCEKPLFMVGADVDTNQFAFARAGS